ncbi:hypothetical protein ACN28C_15130 [Plantactinospora sp. WMMC1484]|uniref:hypothetical protein n=1 Tax=Plantactinospora sp. WMMC1484 TaxID=3404122 RepID=UPI003BF49A15
MDLRSEPARLNLTIARIAIALAAAVTATCIGVVNSMVRPSTDVILVGLCLPTSVGVLLLFRASVYTWRRAATRARAFVVDDGRAFLLLPDRATTRAVAFLLMCTFSVGYPIVEARDAGLGVIEWVVVGLAVVIVPTAVLHAVFVCRGTPRPLVVVTSDGVSVRGFFGCVHVAWDSFASDYAIWPDRQLHLNLPVFARESVQQRGKRPYGVQLPAPYEPLRISAAWSTNPWWAGQAFALYRNRLQRRRQIGSRAAHDILVRQLSIHELEIDEQLERYR